MKRSRPVALFIGCLGLALTTIASHAAESISATTGTVIGTVSSAETRNTLQGAAVTVPATGKAALTDNAGRFVLTDLTAGPVELVVSYTGFDDLRQTVVVSRSEPTRLAVELKS